MSVRVLVGHVLDRLADLPDESVHCVCTSPPYYGLRSYGTEPQVWGGEPNCQHEFETEIVTGEIRTGLGLAALGERYRGGGHKQGDIPKIRAERGFCPCGAWRGDLGLEPTPELFIAHLVEVFREVRRVLRKDGTAWVNLGDSYAGSCGAQGHRETAATISRHSIKSHPKKASHTGSIRSAGLKPKDLMMLPAQLALALRADGWWLRSEIVWAKRAPMPESCTDRPTCAHEKVYLLSKSKTYYYDAEAVKEEASELTTCRPNPSRGEKTRQRETHEHGNTRRRIDADVPYRPSHRNMRNVWHLGPEPFPEAHFATFVSEIPRRAILAGTSARGVCPKCGAPWVRLIRKTFVPGNTSRKAGAFKGLDASIGWKDEPCGTNDVETIGWRASCKCDAGDPIPAKILDCFLGSGTTAMVADQLGRDCIGIELAPSYAAMSERRVRDDAGMFAQIAAE
jgi:DNA modification methylase